MKSSNDETKAQTQLTFELAERTRSIKQEFLTFGVAVYKFAKSIPEVESHLEEFLSLNGHAVEASDFKSLYKKFREGADFINYDIMCSCLSLLGTCDTGEGNTLRLAQEAAEVYKACFKEYAQQRIFLVPTILQNANPVSKELKIKVEEEFHNFKLNRLFYFKKVVKTILKLPPHVNLRFTRVREGCVEICFKMIGAPADKAFHLTIDQKQELLSSNITVLEYDGQVAYCCCELLSDEVLSLIM